MKRYHKNIFMPKLNINDFWKNIPELQFRKHFFYRLKERKKACKGFFVPTIEQLKSGEIFEVYIEKGVIEKMCIRIEGRKSDFCFVVSRVGAVLTVWATGKHNQYDKIDYSVYSKED